VANIIISDKVMPSNIEDLLQEPMEVGGQQWLIVAITHVTTLIKTNSM